MQLPPGYYSTNEVENAIDYLEQAARSYSAPLPHRIKWVLIALHGALYGFAICAVQGTQSTSVLYIPPRVRKEKCLADTPENRYQYGHLISIWKALERCTSPLHMPQYYTSKPLVYRDGEEDAIRSLINTYRNEFMHFKPKGWGIIATDMQVHIIAPVLRVIGFLALESNNIRLTIDQRHRVELAIDTISKRNIVD